MARHSGSVWTISQDPGRTDMTDLTASGFSACPACDAAPLAQRLADRAEAAQGTVILSLPTAHCATCITDVETALTAHPGVKAARVNLTLRRVTVDAPGLTADDLIPVLAGVGYEAHELDPDALSATTADRQGRDLLMRIGVSGFAMMNIMILSVAVWSGAEAATRDLFHWISGAIALPTVFFAGKPFFRSAWSAIRVGRLGMDVPISLALIRLSHGCPRSRYGYGPDDARHGACCCPKISTFALCTISVACGTTTSPRTASFSTSSTAYTPLNYQAKPPNQSRLPHYQPRPTTRS